MTRQIKAHPTDEDQCSWVVHRIQEGKHDVPLFTITFSKESSSSTEDRAEDVAAMVKVIAQNSGKRNLLANMDRHLTTGEARESRETTRQIIRKLGMKPW